MRIRALTFLAAMALAGCGDDSQAAPNAAADGPPDGPLAANSTEVDAVTSGPVPEMTPDSTALAAGEGDGRLYTVQVAAFLDKASAREWEARLTGQGVPAWVATARIHGRTFHRLRVGVAPTLDAASRVGALLRRRYGWPVWVVPLTAADRLPPDVIRATRPLIQRD
jgi:cell division septation protein DedD